MIDPEPLFIPSLFDHAYRAASLAARFAPGSDRDKSRHVLRNVLVLREAMAKLSLYIGGPLIEHDSVIQGLAEVFLLERTFELEADADLSMIVHPDVDGHLQRFGASPGDDTNSFWLGYLRVDMSKDRETMREESAFDFLQRSAATAQSSQEGEDMMLGHYGRP